MLETVSIKSRVGTYGVSVGAFGLLPKKGNATWYTCREQFHRSIGARTCFLFCCGKDTKSNVINFINEVETRSQVPVEQKCKFADTDGVGIIYVAPGPWWSREKIRLSLLTILLRCGYSYSEKTEIAFQKSLYSTSYTQGTKSAIDRFLAGNTHYLGSKSMWVNAFTHYSRSKRPDYVEKSLINEVDVTISEKSMEEADKIVSCRSEVRLMKILLGQALDKAFEEGYQAGLKNLGGEHGQQLSAQSEQTSGVPGRTSAE